MCPGRSLLIAILAFIWASPKLAVNFFRKISQM
jgi:hypothetical protein